MSQMPSTRLVEHLRPLARLSPSALDSIFREIADAPIALYPFETVSAIVEDAVKGELEPVPAKQLGGALGSFAFALASASEPASTSMERFEANLAAELSSEEASAVGSFLRRFANSPNVLTSFKATALYEDGEKLVLSSRLLIDVRPVFDPSTTDKIAASTLLYRLRITCRAPNDSATETVVFTLHDDELSELKAVIVRAGTKAEVLKRLLKNGPLGEILEERS